MKIIPAIDLMDGKVVRLTQGDPKKKTVYSDKPIQIAQKWEDAGADIVHLVDLDATLGLGSNFALVKKIVKKLSIPVQVAGGLRSEKRIDEAMQFAPRIVLGTFALKNPEPFKKIIQKYDKNRIIVSVDHLKGTIVINGWKESTKSSLISGIKKFLQLGCNNFLLTSVSRDGTLQGPDLEFLERACQINGINVIASGGISSLDDVLKVKKCNAYGVILGKALYEKRISIEEVKKLL